jgi:hypothetical protein
VSPTERRKRPRIGLAIPVRVQGFLADGTTWEELSTTDEVSEGGASFPLRRDVELGQVLLLSLALPKRLRQYDLVDTTYRVYSLVRGIRRRADQPHVGVMFFGKFPPRGFHERPAARYLLPSDTAANSPGTGAHAAVATGSVEAPPPTPPPATGAQPSLAGPAPPAAVSAPPAAPRAEPQAPKEEGRERRSFPRVDRFLNFSLQQVDEWGVVLQEELGVADNISRGGLRLMTTLDLRAGDVVLVQEAGGGFASRAEVRAVSAGPAGARRLHLQFLDRQAPDRLLKQ